MPSIEANGLEINYEQVGSGPDLLLIMGLGAELRAWGPVMDELQADFRITAFDNRGTGLSTKASGDYSMSMLAADAAALLVALDIQRAHVFGMSMGGMIAQHLALGWPDLVEKLVLGCSSAGGATMVQPEMWVIGRLTQAPQRESAEAAAELHGPILFGDAWREAHPEQVVEVFRRALERPTPSECFSSQLAAILHHDTRARLGDLSVPTLIVSGDADVIVPVENSRILLDALPQSRLVVLPNVGHALNHEATGALGAAVRSFLLEPAVTTTTA